MSENITKLLPSLGFTFADEYQGGQRSQFCFKIHINKAEGQTFYSMTSKYTQYFRIRFKGA